MPYVTSIERLARAEGRAEGRAEARAEGKLLFLQELLGLPVMSDLELEQLDAQQVESLVLELRKRFDSR